MTPTEFREARKALGLTQAQMAEMLGLGAAARVSEIERGVYKVSGGVARLMRALLDGYRPADWPLAPHTET